MILKGKDHPFYGKHHTEKAKQAISQNNAMNRSVICITTGDIFRSAAEASRKVGIHPSGIIRCCTGKQKTAAKKEWRYFE
ncbi:MAG: NUMOD3 domain-containing DNA-binding protein [Bacillota bacterium]|jgi:cation transport ATPase|nr:NUMOD3 domain-containing DNA-binding protein [Bacillota bacterium]